MYQIDQEIANRIAEIYPMKHKLTEAMFKATEQEAERMEAKLRQQIIEETGSEEAARGFLIVGALYLEREAIGKYRQKHPMLTAALTEILTEEEAILIAERDMMATEEGWKEILRNLLRTVERASKSASND